MFGYVKPYKPDLRIREFDLYQAVYCGLCKQLGKDFGPFARLTLSYDFTFLAMVSLSVSPQCSGFVRSACAANPLKKKTCLQPCDDLSFAAHAAMVLFYYKVKDNIADSGFWKRMLYRMALPFASRARKKTLLRYPFLDQTIGALMEEQARVEKNRSESLDQAADPSARSLAAIFSHLGGTDTQKRILDRMGYLLGKWVYLMDALDDLEEDLKSGGYNPFVRKLGLTQYSKEVQKQVNEYGLGVLNLTVTELAHSYELLDPYRYREILDNVVYLGLKQTQNSLMQRKLLTKKEQKQLARRQKKGLPISEEPMNDVSDQG